MKTNKKLWLAALMLVLALTMSLLFCSCDKTSTDVPADSSDDVTTSEPESTSFDIIKDGKIMVARIVRPEGQSSSPEISAAKQIRDNINSIMTDTFGIELSYDESLLLEEDFLMPGQSYDHDCLEILVGKTAYEESESAFDGLSYGDYAVKVVGNKILVAAYTTSGYSAAASDLNLLIKQNIDKDTKSVTIQKADVVSGGTSNKRISALPAYEGGVFNSYYKAGNSVDEIIIKKTSMDEFNSYLKKLDEAGYTCYTTNEIKSNKFATYTNASYTVNAGYYDYESSARIMIEPLAEAVPLEPAKYEKVTTSQITMLGLEYANTDGSFTSNGLSMLIRLEDGSFIVVDGGFNRASCANNLLALMREQSKSYAKSDKDIRVAAWIITHAHGDHSGMINNSYGVFQGITVENFLVNFISDTEREKAITTYSNNWGSTEGSGYSSVLTAAGALGAKVRTVHVGQTFYFADAKLEIMYTIESFGPNVCNAFNTTSLVIKATISDTVFMITGDATGNGMQAAAKTFGDYLKSDIVQVSHHGYTTWGNDSGTIMAYRLMAPATLLWPQGGHAYPNYTGKEYNKVLTDKTSNPNYVETYVAGTDGDVIIIPLPYTVGTGIVNRGSASYMTGASSTKK